MSKEKVYYVRAKFFGSDDFPIVGKSSGDAKKNFIKTICGQDSSIFNKPNQLRDLGISFKVVRVREAKDISNA